MSELLNMSHSTAPRRSHWPVLTADYKKIDESSGYGDAHFLDIGQSTWNKEDYSAKIWRWAEYGQRWSRQGEEIPLSRVLDLAILVVSAITGRPSSLQEFVQNEEQKDAMSSYLTENMQLLGPKIDELRRILLSTAHLGVTTGCPNLFSFATSELCQDAVFTWLLSWADPQCVKIDPSLHAVAMNFISLITGNCTLSVKKITTGRQWAHIDVWAEINDDTFLVIEDKTGTTVHDNQLLRYRTMVEREYPNRAKYYAYIKTGNEPKSRLKAVSEAGYRIVLRKDIIACLDGYVGGNALLCDYREHLRKQENEMQSYKSLPVKNWSWSAWEGFYTELEHKIELDNWSYVANRSGGFLAAWWHWIPLGKDMGEMYLQFEQQDLCFKICPKCEINERSGIRNKCHEILMQKAQGRFPEIIRPQKFGAGEYMTIAKVRQEDIFGIGVVNFDDVVDRLKRYESFVDECCGLISANS